MDATHFCTGSTGITMERFWETDVTLREEMRQHSCMKYTVGR